MTQSTPDIRIRCVELALGCTTVKKGIIIGLDDDEVVAAAEKFEAYITGAKPLKRARGGRVHKT